MQTPDLSIPRDPFDNVTQENLRRMYSDVRMPAAAVRLPNTVHAVGEQVYQSLGAASTCWESMEGTGVFDSDRCKQIGDELMSFILEKTGLGEPKLGLATTEELVQELHTRIALGHGADPKYRSIDD